MRPLATGAGHPPRHDQATRSETPVEARIQAEVEALHRFFEDWFGARLPADDTAFARLRASLAPGFQLISPEGQVLERQALLDGLRAAHGAEVRSGLAIAVLPGGVRSLGPGLWLVTYQEWHRRGDESRGRQSSAVLEEHAAAPGGFVWRHVHETWLSSVSG